MRVTVTGGAGFIGVTLTRRLLSEGCSVTVLDSFEPQIHGSAATGQLPSEIASDVRLVIGSVRDQDQVARALDRADAVVHLAAETGTGQSMYELTKYADTNVGGTTQVIDQIVRQRPRTVQKLVVASSRAIYGEGKYLCSRDGSVFPGPRHIEDLMQGEFEPRCPVCNAFANAVPTDEDSPASPASFYGLTKLIQEETVSLVGQALLESTHLLRFQNVYGPGQSLNNPYTGILAIFANEIRLGRPIELFEDGRSTRDFIYVEDAVDAVWRCLVRGGSEHTILNVGSGVASTVAQIAQHLKQTLDGHVETSVSGAFRIGDVRHAVADIRRSYDILGFRAQWNLERGMRELVNWVQRQPIGTSRYRSSLQEIRSQGLLLDAKRRDPRKIAKKRLPAQESG